MDFERLDKQDEKTIGATKRAEERIVREILLATLFVSVISISAVTIAMCAMQANLNLWLGLFVAAIIVLFITLNYKVIDKAISTTHAEFRKLEGFVSIATMNLVEEIERDKK